MNAHVHGLLSFSGDRLTGSNLVRIVYVDEAGISNPAHEPYVVVAAVAIHGDNDSGRITKLLEALADEYELPWIASFHAKDIWHGNGPFDRNDPKWPLSRRRQLLSRLANIPAKLGLPVAIGYVNRKAHQQATEDYYRKLERDLGRPFKRPTSPHLLQHAEAFVRAAKAIDSWMQVNAPTERAMLIAEDAPQVKNDLKMIQAIAQSRTIDIGLFLTESFKTVHIIETVHFAGKKDSPFLQLADTCAFVAKRKLMRKADIDSIYAHIEPQIIRLRRTSF